MEEKYRILSDEVERLEKESQTVCPFNLRSVYTVHSENIPHFVLLQPNYQMYKIFSLINLHTNTP
jgi:hypothetical protein